MKVLESIKGWNADSKWWHWTYFVEWPVSLCFAGVLWLILRHVRPFCRDFNPLDPTISYPFEHHEAFPNWTLPFLGFCLPFVWVAALSYVSCRRSAATPRPINVRHEVHALALALLQANMFSMVLTDPMKNYAGRLRPDYVSRLEEVLHFNPHNFTQADLTAACDSTVSKVMDGRRSFPSGHASLTWAGWTVVALYVSVKAFNGERRMGITFVNLLCVAVNLVVPAWVAISRTRDYRHNFGDVLAGSAIGVFAGVVCFVQHFSLMTDVCF